MLHARHTRQFVTSVWNFCSIPQRELSHFAFLLFDDHRHGLLDLHKVHLMMTCFLAKPPDDDRWVLHFLDTQNLYEYMDKHPTLMSKLLAAQVNMKTCCCGEHFWNNKEQRRQKMMINRSWTISVESSKRSRINLSTTRKICIQNLRKQKGCENWLSCRPRRSTWWTID